MLVLSNLLLGINKLLLTCCFTKITKLKKGCFFYRKVGNLLISAKTEFNLFNARDCFVFTIRKLTLGADIVHFRKLSYVLSI